MEKRKLRMDMRRICCMVWRKLTEFDCILSLQNKKLKKQFMKLEGRGFKTKGMIFIQLTTNQYNS